MFGRIRVGIMGTGRIAGKMAVTLKAAKGATCYAVGSRTIENATKFAQENGVKKFYGSYEGLLNDPKVDLVYVATPHSEHYENVKLALNAGKNVICEKAFMLNEEQAKEVFKIAEEKKVLLTEAMWTRYMPMRYKINEILSSNVIGEPTMLTANLGYNIVYKDRINQPELGGGCLLDLGVYVLNFASMVFGNEVADIASICTFNNLGMDMQDSITLRYANGRMAVLNATVLSTGDRNAVIYGTKGYMVVENVTNPEGIAVYDNDYRKIAYYRRPKQKTGYEYEIEACVKALSEGWLECPDMPHSESLKILNMMDFIRRNNNILFPVEKTAQQNEASSFKLVTLEADEAPMNNENEEDKTPADEATAEAPAQEDSETAPADEEIKNPYVALGEGEEAVQEVEESSDSVEDDKEETISEEES